jgi:hypothetical protein
MDTDKRGYEESRFLTQSHEDAEGCGTSNIEGGTWKVEVRECGSFALFVPFVAR